MDNIPIMVMHVPPTLVLHSQIVFSSRKKKILVTLLYNFLATNLQNLGIVDDEAKRNISTNNSFTIILYPLWKSFKTFTLQDHSL